jgi:predicted dehydrogenase
MGWRAPSPRPPYRQHAGLQLVSVVTSNPDRQARARRERPGVGVLSHVSKLWQAAEEHDLVVVATNTATHLLLGLAAVQAGLAVVVDKPLALTAAEGRRLATAARKRGVLLTVFHNRRWDGDLRTLRCLLDADALGSVHRFESRFERWRPAPRPGPGASWSARRPVGACCLTSAVTWWTRLCCCSGSQGASTPRSTGIVLKHA